MTLLSLARAWLAVHPYECAVFALVALSILNGLLKGPPTSLLGVVIDRLSVLVRSDAKGTLSWPVLGRSVFEGVREYYQPGPKPEIFRDPPQHSGFAQLRVLRAVALGAVCIAAFSLVGCASQGDGMTQFVSGYSTFRAVAQRICGVVTLLPPPPTPSAPPLDAGVP